MIDNAGKGFTIVHPHVFLVLEPLNLEARHTLCHRLVPHINLVVHPWDGLGCFDNSKRMHFREQADKFDDQIAVGLDFKVADFSGV